jgi:hypothetical protein
MRQNKGYLESHLAPLNSALLLLSLDVRGNRRRSSPHSLSSSMSPSSFRVFQLAGQECEQRREVTRYVDHIEALVCSLLG